MTVRELIGLLRFTNLDARVFVLGEDESGTPVLRDLEGVSPTHSTAFGPGVVIELED